MSLPLIDIVLLVIIALFAIKGFAAGFIKSILSIIGLLASIYIASRYYEPMAHWLVQVAGWGQNVSKVLMFVVAFILLNALVNVAFWILEKVFNIILFLPFMTTLNRLLGLLFGALEGALALGIIFYFVERFPLSTRIMDVVATSHILSSLDGLTVLLLPLLPMALRLLTSSVDFLEQQVR